MAERAALVTGASSGIGLATAEMLGEEGYELTVAARRPEKLDAAADGLRATGYDVNHVAGNLGDEETIKAVVAQHAERFGRLDVLVSNAGVGFGEPVDELTTKRIDMHLNTNLRAIFLFYRECAELLKAAGAEHRNALVVHIASISGKAGEGWLSFYPATKHGVVGFIQAMNKDLADVGIKSTALCPGLVDTPMTEFAREVVAQESMITTRDVAESVRHQLRTSPGCVIPGIRFLQPGGGFLPSAA